MSGTGDDEAGEASPSPSPVRAQPAQPAEPRAAALAIALLCGICLVLGFGLGFFLGRGW